eukprot:6174419-Pleurochrysis_carterae.AAC.1
MLLLVFVLLIIYTDSCARIFAQTLTSTRASMHARWHVPKNCRRACVRLRVRALALTHLLVRAPSNIQQHLRASACVLRDFCADFACVSARPALQVATGRVPRVSGMDLKKIGVSLNSKKGIAVDAQLRTGCAGVYAAGDCTGDQQFTHYAGFQGGVAARNLLLPLKSAG